MIRSRREAIDEIVDMMNENNDSVGRNKAERILLPALEIVWLKHPWRSFQVPDPLQIQLVANLRRYPLLHGFGRVGPGKVVNLTRGYAFEDEWDPTLFQAAYPEAGTSFEVAGTPCRWLRQGTSSVVAQPISPNLTLEVVSNSAQDTDVVCFLSGVEANTNLFADTQVTLNGLTPVALGSWIRVDAFGKSFAPTTTPPIEFSSSRGVVDLRVVATGLILSRLFLNQSSVDYPTIVIHPKPATADVLAVPIIRQPIKPMFDGDPLPENWWPALFEECCIQYRVNTGDLSDPSGVPRPMLMDLIAFDNQSQPRPRPRMFRG